MDNKKMFEKYYSRLAREGMIKATLCGLIFGFAVNLLISAVSWLISRYVDNWLLTGVILSIVAGVVFGIIAGFVSYYKFFKPTNKKVARRIDQMGLEERLITMAEYNEDDSYMAEVQRADAKAKLNEVDKKAIKFKIAKIAIVAAAVLCVLSLSMTTVNALTVAEVISDPSILWPTFIEPEESYVVMYLVDGQGHIEDEDNEVQYVKRGEDAETVTAVAEEGFYFIGWSDGYPYAERTDKNVQDYITAIALFESIDGVGGEGGSGGSANPDDDVSNEETENPKEDDDENNQNSNNNNNPSQGPESSAGRYEEGSKVYDNESQQKKPYQDVFPELYEKWLEELANDKTMTEEERRMFEEFLKAMMAGVENED